MGSDGSRAIVMWIDRKSDDTAGKQFLDAPRDECRTMTEHSRVVNELIQPSRTGREAREVVSLPRMDVMVSNKCEG
ncbi:hypothetical protein GCM10007385_39510 [Tateyamaria omphalii]|nr:hypothetical protein GCM10007385_39510 [Tateyamaria omphalii]